MNKMKRKTLGEIRDRLDSLKEMVESEADDEKKKIECMISEEMRETAESALDSMRSAIDSIEESIGYLEEAAE